MPNILFVCTANQFRSPLCAAFFEKKIQDKGIGDHWIVKSAGTWVPRKAGAHPTAIREGRKLGVDLSQHKSCEIDATMIETADLVVVMTMGQKEALQIEFAEQSEKIYLLGEFTGNPALDFSDPAENGFLEADISANELFREIENCTENILNLLTKKQLMCRKNKAGIPNGNQ